MSILYPKTGIIKVVLKMKKKKQKKHTQQQKHTNNSSHFNFLLNECHQIKLFKGTVKGKIEKALINGRLRCFKSIIKTSLSNY